MFFFHPCYPVLPTKAPIATSFFLIITEVVYAYTHTHSHCIRFSLLWKHKLFCIFFHVMIYLGGFFSYQYMYRGTKSWQRSINSLTYQKMELNILKRIFSIFGMNHIYFLINYCEELCYLTLWILSYHWIPGINSTPSCCEVVFFCYWTLFPNLQQFSNIFSIDITFISETDTFFLTFYLQCFCSIIISSS